MSRQYEQQNGQGKPITVEYECKDCKDTGILLEKVESMFGDRRITKDVGRPCHCLSKKALANRFQNALIPDEFKDARLKTYKKYDETTTHLYESTVEYLSSIQEIIRDKHTSNSLGFIAVLGETRIREMQSEERYDAKEKHNSFGLGKTHLQMAAAKWILNKVKIYDEIAPGQYSSIGRGCTVLCLSDITFMNDLTNARMMNDGGQTLNKLMTDAITADVLVWDDMGKTKWSETKEGFYYQIINERYNNKRPILFSSNEDAGSLSEKIGYAAASRLFGMCGDRLYSVEGNDYRQNKVV